MYPVHFLSIIFWFGFTIEASHFRGGTITWKPINNNITNGSIVPIMITQTYSWTLSQVGCNSSMIATQSPLINLGGKSGSGADLMCNASCSTSGGYVGHEVPITGYCTDYSIALDLTVSQRSDIVNLTSGAHFTATFGAGGGWQSLALGSSSGWSISSVIDLRVRSDNGLINTLPVATCISYISVPVNIQQTIQIPVLDADNDFLRCRFANGSTECVNTCPPGSLPSGTSLSSSCILTITGITAGDYYLVAIQVEDFITSTSTTALSSVPLQFLINVYAVPNCTLKPLLISDFNSGVCQGAQVGVNFTMTFTVINRCGSGRNISDIATLSFPIVIKSALVQSVTNTSLWSMEITWVPTASQVGSQVFCAVAVDSADVQSDQYCTTLFVGLSDVPLCPGATAAPTTTTTIATTTTATTQTLTTTETATTTRTSTTAATTIQTSTTTETATQTSTTAATTTQTSTTTVSTSLITQITSVIPSSTLSTTITSLISTEAITTMEITSVSTVTTSTMPSSSLVSSSTVKSGNTINWPFIIGLSLLALALAVCCSLCCLYHLIGPGAHRRRRRTDNPEKSQGNRKPHQKFSKRFSRKQPYEREQSSIIISTIDSRTPNSVPVTKTNQREKSFIDGQENVLPQPSPEKTADHLNKSKRRVSFQKIDVRDKTPQFLALNKMPSTLQERDNLLTDSLSASTAQWGKSVNVMKIPRPPKSSVEPHQSTSTLSVKIKPTKNLHRDLSGSGSTRKNQGSVSNVSVSKIKRSSSTGPINRINQVTATTSSNIDLSRVTVIKMK